MTYTEQKPTVFTSVTTDAQPGDFFNLPYCPHMKVISRIDLGDYVSYVVQSGSNKPEQWEIMKPEVEQREQERNRIEAGEVEMGEIVYEAALQELEQTLGFSLRSDAWLTEPIGTNPDAIFGAFIPPSDEEIATLSVALDGYHDPNWTSEDCEF